MSLFISILYSRFLITRKLGLGYINEESNRSIFGAADVYTSIQDLVKWINNYRTAEIGSKEVMDLFLEPFILNDGSNSEYALGIGNSSYR